MKINNIFFSLLLSPTLFMNVPILKLIIDVKSISNKTCFDFN